VPRANDLTGFHLSVSQRFAVVCATVFYCVKVVSAAYDNYREAVDLDREGCRLMNGHTLADIDPL
jgi:hypothetical protein